MEEVNKMLVTLLKGQKKLATGQQSLVERVKHNELVIRATINGQSALKADLLKEIGNVKSGLSSHRKETKNGFIKVSKRIDIIGTQVAYLEDDAPTRDEHGKLEERVDKLETPIAPV